MKFKPNGDLILVKKLAEEEIKTKSGLILPSSPTNDFVKVKAEALGPLVHHAKKRPIKQGDILVVPTNALMAVLGEQFCYASQVIAIIDPE